MTIPLSDLKHGQSAKVNTLHASGSIRHRLLDLGLIPGTVIERVLSSPVGDPICYKICGAMIALRNSDANQILVDL